MSLSGSEVSMSLVYRKLETARTLVSCFVSAARPSAVAQPISTSFESRTQSLPLGASDLYSMPLRVRAHYVKVLLDWVAAALTKPKSDSNADSEPSTFLQYLQHRWQLLFVLLASTDSPAQTAPNITLIAAAAAACKGCSIEKSTTVDGQKLALALQQTLLVLNTKYRRSFRPSLDHR